jgi:hypothetical protein
MLRYIDGVASDIEDGEEAPDMEYAVGYCGDNAADYATDLLRIVMVHCLKILTHCGTAAAEMELKRVKWTAKELAAFGLLYCVDDSREFKGVLLREFRDIFDVCKMRADDAGAAAGPTTARAAVFAMVLKEFQSLTTTFLAQCEQDEARQHLGENTTVAPRTYITNDKLETKDIASATGFGRTLDTDAGQKRTIRGRENDKAKKSKPQDLEVFDEGERLVVVANTDTEPPKRKPENSANQDSTAKKSKTGAHAEATKRHTSPNSEQRDHHYTPLTTNYHVSQPPSLSRNEQQASTQRTQQAAATEQTQQQKTVPVSASTKTDRPLSADEIFSHPDMVKIVDRMITSTIDGLKHSYLPSRPQESNTTQSGIQRLESVQARLHSSLVRYEGNGTEAARALKSDKAAAEMVKNTIEFCVSAGYCSKTL